MHTAVSESRFSTHNKKNEMEQKFWDMSRLLRGRLAIVKQDKYRLSSAFFDFEGEIWVGLANVVGSPRETNAFQGAKGLQISYATAQKAITARGRCSP